MKMDAVIKVLLAGVNPRPGGQFRNGVNAAGFILAAFIMSNPVSARENDADASSRDTGEIVEVIVVTAKKREQRLSDVPMSIAAASAKELSDLGVTQPEDLVRISPGLTYQPSFLNNPIYSIRGIGFHEAAIGVSPAVTVYTDEVPLPYSAMARGAALDLERVEILKGPQGTVFGQNATGGAINYVAAKPTNELAAGLDLRVGRFNQFDGEGYVGGPISSNLTGRIAIRNETRDGWQYSPDRNGQAYGRTRFLNARALLEWEPTSAASFRLNVNGWRDRSQVQAPQFLEFLPQRPTRTEANAPAFDAYEVLTRAPDDARLANFSDEVIPSSETNFFQVSLRGDVDLSDTVTLTSVTAYSDYDTVTRSDIDGATYGGFSADVLADVSSFTQELRLSQDMAAFNWMVGASFQSDKIEETRDIVLGATNNNAAGFVWQGIVNETEQETQAYSVFGNFTYSFTDRLSLEAGIRQNWQPRDFSGCLDDSGDGALANAFEVISAGRTGMSVEIPPGGCVTLNDDLNSSVPLFAPVSVVEDELDEDNFSWRVGVNFAPTDETLLYANVTRGYKSGTFTVLSAVTASQFTPIAQESVLAYEVGLKKAMANRAVQLNAATFFYDYTDKQILGRTTNLFGVLNALINIPESRVYGAEFEVKAQPAKGLRVSSAVTYVNAEVKKDPLPPFIALDGFGGAVSFVGEQFPNTPKWQAVLNAQYEFPLGNDAAGFIGVSGIYRTSESSAFGGLPEFEIDGYGLLDLQVGLRFNDNRFQIMAWGKNVTNEFYVTSVQRPSDNLTRFTGQPATYGVALSYRY